MTANVYRLFRFIIADESEPYIKADFYTLTLLDKAIDAISGVVDYTFQETLDITQSDIDTGYKEFSHEVQYIVSPRLYMNNIFWELGGAKKLRFINPSFSPQSITFIYRARYKKFEGVVREQSYMDLPTELDLAVVKYALALYMEDQGIATVNAEFGFVSRKREENMEVEYGGNSLSALFENTTPKALKESAIIMARYQTNVGQNPFISVKI